jgi:hypothetical protein
MTPSSNPWRVALAYHEPAHAIGCGCAAADRAPGQPTTLVERLPARSEH